MSGQEIPMLDLTLRTHPKVLFLPTVRAALVLVAIVAAFIFTPMVVSVWWAPLVVAGAVLVLGGLTVLIPFLRWWYALFSIDSRRIESRTGILYRNSVEIPLHRITQVSCEQGILDRMFGCGTLILADASATSDSGGVRFHDIPRVRQVRDQLNAHLYLMQEPTL